MSSAKPPFKDERDHFPPVLYVITRTLDTAGFALLFLFLLGTAVSMFADAESTFPWVRLCIAGGLYAMSFVLCIGYETLRGREQPNDDRLR